MGGRFARCFAVSFATMDLYPADEDVHARRGTYDRFVPSAPPRIDLLDPSFYVDGAREAYAWMRRNSPAHFDEKNGCWGIATYDGVREAEGNAVVFSNAGGSRPESGPLPWMIDMDAPAHRKRRKLVSGAFTPARVRGSAPRIREICDELIDAVSRSGASAIFATTSRRRCR